MKKILGWAILAVVLVTALYFGALAAGVPDDVAITCFIGVVVFLICTETVFVDSLWLANIFRQPIASVYKSTIITSCILVALFAGISFFGDTSLQEAVLALYGFLLFGGPVFAFMTASNYKDRVGLVFFAHLVGIGGICGVVELRTWWPAAIAVVILGVWWFILHVAERIEKITPAAV